VLEQEARRRGRGAVDSLERCTSFLLDLLIEDSGGFLESNPPTSPEYMFIAPDQKQAIVSYSSTMDISIIKEVFSIVISAAEVSYS
jgi:alpha-L-fucosidase 2